jgi:hypothetical protein
MSGRTLIAVVLGALIASPVLAQEQPATPGGNRQQTDQGGGGNGGGRGGRGNFDPAQMRERFATMIKEQLAPTDDEWKVIQPKLDKVMEMQRDARGGGMGGMFGGRRRGGDTGGGNGGGGTDTSAADTNRSPTQTASRDLRQLLDNKDATPEQIAAKLTALREARDKARASLQTAQKDLKEVLSPRQEAVLVMMGMLD